MRLLQFAIPERLGGVCAEAACRLAGGATLLPNAMGWWIDERGEVQRERVNWLIVGAQQVDEVVNAIKAILKSEGEAAIFYVVDGNPSLEWL